MSDGTRTVDRQLVARRARVVIGWTQVGARGRTREEWEAEARGLAQDALSLVDLLDEYDDSTDYDLIKVRGLLERAVQALRGAEHSQSGIGGCCPVCGNLPDEWKGTRGHEPDCELAAVLLETTEIGR